MLPWGAVLSAVHKPSSLSAGISCLRINDRVGLSVFMASQTESQAKRLRRLANSGCSGGAGFLYQLLVYVPTVE